MSTNLQQKLSEMTKPIESRTTSNEEIDDTVEPSNSIGVGVNAGQSEVDIQAAETMIRTFLSSGLEILKFPAEVTKIREACDFLTSPQLTGMMPMQRKAAIYCLKSELDNLISRLYGASTLIDKDNELKSRQAQFRSVATEKLKEIDQIRENNRLTLGELNEAKKTLSTLERQMAEVKTIISNGENKLQTLCSRFKELITEMRNLQVTNKIAIQEHNGLLIQLHKANEDRRYVEEQWKSIQSLFGVGE